MEKFSQIEKSEEFQELKRSKRRFIWPVTIIFFLYYLSFPLMAGYAKPLMSSFVFANFTFGYLFGLSFYIVAWTLAFIYVIKARGYDKKIEVIKEKYLEKEGT
ncbi:DUF485 domain-containing protein [Virgibacillus sp. C22-A2]|uniref:DUF485 domain-containing protein n=1 Tax=Virgibacillus tibetensis TaxID=3042313 RepID=A0ABU6KK54_9BACI|nr:DUF485 domain-containing protein [Virgibacillus sp. C22-A2]